MKYEGPTGETWTDDTGQTITNVHPAERCEGHCPLHNPSNHHMQDWPLAWRWEHYYFERICPHGIGHPDPDSLAYLEEIATDLTDVGGIHGCDGCCTP